jgi:hypothetical protein
MAVTVAPTAFAAKEDSLGLMRGRSESVTCFDDPFREDRKFIRSGEPYEYHRKSGRIMWASDIREGRNESIYYADFAVEFGAGPADDVLRIWADWELIYDKRRDSGAGLDFRFYPGDDDQLPDPLIESDVTPTRCPAFRGTCYIVFERLPLEDYGNSIPNITAEIAYCGAPSGRPQIKTTEREESENGREPKRRKRDRPVQRGPQAAV